MTSVPKIQKAVVVTEDRRTRVEEVPVPGKLSEGFDLLVRVHSVALNPTDWKHINSDLPGFGLPAGAHTGSDFAGTVAEEAGGFKAGERVAGFTRGGALHNENGAFAEYVRVNPTIVWRIPSSTSFEEAAAIGGIPADTAAQSLFDPKRLGLAWPSQPVKSSEWILVWSGATAVGWYAIQLAKAAGYKVVTTASPKNHDALRQLGADEVFDYKDADAPQKIKALTDDSLRYGLDTISEKNSTQTAQLAYGSKGGKVVVLLPPKKEEGTWRQDVEVKHTLIYSVLQKDKFPGDQDTIAQFHRDLPGLIEAGKFRSIKVTKRAGGLSAIWDGLEDQKAGKVSAEKYVFNVE